MRLMIGLILAVFLAIVFGFIVGLAITYEAVNYMMKER